MVTEILLELSGSVGSYSELLVRSKAVKQALLHSVSFPPPSEALSPPTIHCDFSLLLSLIIGQGHLQKNSVILVLKYVF